MDFDELRDWISEKSDHHLDWFLYPEEYKEFLEEAEDRAVEEAETDEIEEMQDYLEDDED